LDAFNWVAESDRGHFRQFTEAGIVILSLKNLLEAEPRESFPFGIVVVVVVVSQANAQAARSHDTDVEHAVVAVEDVDAGLLSEVSKTQAGLALTLSTHQPEAFACAYAGMPFHLFTTPEQAVVQNGHEAISQAVLIVVRSSSQKELSKDKNKTTSAKWPASFFSCGANVSRPTDEHIFGGNMVTAFCRRCQKRMEAKLSFQQLTTERLAPRKPASVPLLTRS
jgi:hypothetical protein